MLGSIFCTEAKEVNLACGKSIGKYILYGMLISVIFEGVSDNCDLNLLLCNYDGNLELKLFCRSVVGNVNENELVGSCIANRSAEVILPLPMSFLSLGKSEIREGVTVCCREIGNDYVCKHSVDAKVTCKLVWNS